jgi:hypothetical protein
MPAPKHAQPPALELTVELDREEDGRWIATVRCLA